LLLETQISASKTDREKGILAMDQRFSHLPPAAADGSIAKNVRRIAHMDLPGGAQVLARDGLVFVSHMSPPHGTSIIDARDPKNPSLLASVTLPDAYSHSHKVALAGDLMLVNSQRHKRRLFRKAKALEETVGRLTASLGQAPTDAQLAEAMGLKEGDLSFLRDGLGRGYDEGGFRLFDIADPARPRQIGFCKTGGAGVHGIDCDGRYAYVSTEMEGYRGNILVNYDISDPTRPEEVSHWSMPGQEAPGSSETTPIGATWLHHALRCGDKLWLACWGQGITVLDATDMGNLKELGSFNYHPPFTEPTHTVMALPQKYKGKDLALAIDEEHDNHPVGQPHAALWVFDVTNPADMKPLSVFEVSELDSPWSRGFERFGAGQIVEHATGDRVFATWFAGGLRIVNIADPTRPTEEGFFIPAPAPGASSPQSMDVEVDERGLIYLLDRNGALDILEMES
jgi:hypothetical protein